MAIASISKKEVTQAAGGAFTLQLAPDYLHLIYIKYVVIPGGCWPGPQPVVVFGV